MQHASVADLGVASDNKGLSMYISVALEWLCFVQIVKFCMLQKPIV